MATKYTAEQKQTIVNKACKLIREGGSLSAVAKEVGVAYKSLKSWIDSMAKSEGDTSTDPTPVKTKKSKRPTSPSTKRKARTTANKSRSATKAESDETRTSGSPKAEVGAQEKDSGQISLKVISLPNSTVVAIGSQSHEVKSEHPKSEQIKSLLEQYGDSVTEEQAQELTTLIEGEKIQALKQWSQGKLNINNGLVTWDGKPIVGGLKTVLIKLAESGDTSRLQNFSNFIEKVRQCTSYKINQRFFDFISKNSLQITEDGDIIAFKVVRGNYMDKHSGTFDNSVGKIVEMPRNEVDDQDTNTCSNGLHICSESYIKSFSSSGDRLVLVKVDPRDICSIPTDYQSTKCRTCRYEVVKDVTEEWKQGKHLQYTDDYKFAL